MNKRELAFSIMMEDLMEPYYYYDGGKKIEHKRQYGVSAPPEVLKQMRERLAKLSWICLQREQDPE